LRRVLSGLLALMLGAALLAGCGGTITITIPGGTAAGPAAAPKPKPPALPKGYARLYSPAPQAFRYSQGAEPVRRGAVSERFELRDRDCGGTDCGNFRARAEIAQDRTVTTARLDRDIWYGWSFYNATMGAVTRETSLGTVLGQWKLEGDVPSSFRLVQVAKGEGDLKRCNPAVCTQGGAPDDDVMLELDEVAQALHWGAAQNQGRICRLFGMEANRGRWVDLVVNTNFGTDGYGYVRVWVNGEMRCNYQGQVVSARAARAAGTARTTSPGPTDRRGIFNSYTERWSKAFGARPKPTMVAFYDEFVSGPSRADVDPRLRAARGLPPLD
jgi:hypothetical protein